MIREYKRVYVQCDECGACCLGDYEHGTSNTIEEVITQAEEDGWQFPTEVDEDLCPSCVKIHGGKPTWTPEYHDGQERP
jgi:hypothetical protein